MADPNAPQLDPVTGLPSYMLDTGTIQQIQLNSQPLIAPEWQPQGRVQSVYWPDNIPTFLSTLQAHNNANPGVVQAATTDGKGNLNVNVASGGGGSSGGGVVATKTFETNQDITAPSIHSPMTINRVCSFMMAVYLDTPAGTTDRSDVYFVCLTPVGTTSPRVQLGMVSVSVNADATNPLHFVAQYSHDFTNPLDPCTMLGLAPGSDLQLRADGMSWATGSAYMALHYT